MKCRVAKEEWYPMYILDQDGPPRYPQIEVEEGVFYKWANLQAEWEDMQAEIGNLLRGQI